MERGGARRPPGGLSALLSGVPAAGSRQGDLSVASLAASTALVLRGQTVQMMKAMEQRALDHGAWYGAWKLTGLVDPARRREYAGTEQDMSFIAAHSRAEKQLRDSVSKGARASTSGGGDGCEGGLSKRAERRQRSAAAKSEAKKKEEADKRRVEAEKKKAAAAAAAGGRAADGTG